MKSILYLSFAVAYLFFQQHALGAEGDTYGFSWLDQDKEVYVLQNRKFRKVHKLHFTLGGGITTSGAFVDAKAIQVRAGYFFVEDWGFEVIYSANSGKENSTAASVRNQGGAGSTPFRRIVDNYFGAMALWAPFYSKINTFNTIIYLDWIFGLGLAKIEESNNRAELSNQSDLTQTQESHTGIIWNTGLKFYLTRNFSARVDMTAVHYKAQEGRVGVTSSEEKFFNNFDLTASIGYSF